jgi:hypothetical protein
MTGQVALGLTALDGALGAAGVEPAYVLLVENREGEGKRAWQREWPDRRPTLAECVRWLQGGAGHHVGLQPGPMGLLAFDVDDGDGPEVVATWCRERGAFACSAPSTSGLAHKGHVFARVSEPVGNGNFRLDDPLDGLAVGQLRCDRGQVRLNEGSMAALAAAAASGALTGNALAPEDLAPLLTGGAGRRVASDFDTAAGADLDEAGCPDSVLARLREPTRPERHRELNFVVSTLAERGFSFDSVEDFIRPFVEAWPDGGTGEPDGKFAGDELRRHMALVWRAPDFDDATDLLDPELRVDPGLVERERNEDRRIGDTSPRGRLGVRRIALDDAKRDLVYVSIAGGVVDLKSGRAWKTVELAATHFAGSRTVVEPEEPAPDRDAASDDGPKRGRPRQPKEMRVVNVWVGDKGGERKTVDLMTWAPGRGLICPAPEGRGTAVNVWQEPKFPEAPEDWRERASKFEDHVRWLLPDGTDADDFLDWVAHIVQRPGVLPHTAWLMITQTRGIGRNWVASVLARVLAGHVALGVDLGDLLGGSFNERLSEKLLLVVDETREGSGADRYRKANRLQKVITEEHREINPKFGLKSVQYNCCRFLMFSNFMDALPIDDRDRRIRVAYNPQATREPSYYSDLYRTRRDPAFLASVARMLRERDISAFNPGGIAPMTYAKRSVVEFLESDERRELRSLFAEWPSDLIGLSDVKEHLALTCGSVPSNLKFLVDEAAGATTKKRFNQPGTNGGEKDYVVVARVGEWDARRVESERPTVLREIIVAARGEWASRSVRE